jgi:hypothetical protein
MASNRLGIANGLVTLLSGITNPNTSQPLYGAVQLGALFEPSPGYTSWASVAFFQGKSGPAGSGGNLIGWRIEDLPTYFIMSGWDYEVDSASAMTNMLTTMDILLPILHSHVVIPDPNNPSIGIASVWSVLTDQPDRAVPVRVPNGHMYLLWHVYVAVKQQYNVTLVSP